MLEILSTAMTIKNSVIGMLEVMEMGVNFFGILLSRMGMYFPFWFNYCIVKDYIDNSKGYSHVLFIVSITMKVHILYLIYYVYEVARKGFWLGDIVYDIHYWNFQQPLPISLYFDILEHGVLDNGT